MHRSVIITLFFGCWVGEYFVIVLEKERLLSGGQPQPVLWSTLPRADKLSLFCLEGGGQSTVVNMQLQARRRTGCARGVKGLGRTA